VLSRVTTGGVTVRTVTGVRIGDARLVWQDWAVPAVLLVGAQAELWFGWVNLTGPRLLYGAVSLVAAAALLARRRHPLLALVAASTALLLPSLFGWFAQSFWQVLMFVVAVFAAGRYATLRKGLAALVFSMAVGVVGSAADPSTDLASSWGWSLNAVWIFALGVAFRRESQLRARAATAGAAQARAEAAEAQLRLARNLHDVLSHSLSVIVVQSEVADTYLRHDPARTQQAIARVAQVARSALAESRELVSTLRSDPHTTGAAPLPGLDELPALIARVRDSGVNVVYRTDDNLPSLSPEARHTAYRLVQESLTNVIRHANKADTVVSVTSHHNDLVIEIRNDGDLTDEPAAPAGHGLAGMHERVRALGGALTTGPVETGGFTVHAVLLGSPQP
jgi:signal transduction histidine kinase